MLIGWKQISDGRYDLVSERRGRRRGILEYDICPGSRVQPRMTWVLAYLQVPVHDVRCHVLRQGATHGDWHLVPMTSASWSLS